MVTKESLFFTRRLMPFVLLLSLLSSSSGRSEGIVSQAEVAKLSLGQIVEQVKLRHDRIENPSISEGFLKLIKERHPDMPDLELEVAKSQEVWSYTPSSFFATFAPSLLTLGGLGLADLMQSWYLGTPRLISYLLAKSLALVGAVSSNFLVSAIFGSMIAAPLKKKIYKSVYNWTQDRDLRADSFSPSSSDASLDTSSDEVKFLKLLLRYRKHLSPEAIDADPFLSDYLLPFVSYLNREMLSIAESGELESDAIIKRIAEKEKEALLGFYYALVIVSAKTKAVGGSEKKMNLSTLERIQHVKGFFTSPDDEADFYGLNDANNERQVSISQAINLMAGSAHIYSQPQQSSSTLRAYYFQGPPGVGKTALVHALAWSLDMGLAVTSHSEDFRSMFGKSKLGLESNQGWKALKHFDGLSPLAQGIFNAVDSQGRLSKNYILFIDEIDKFGSGGREILGDLISGAAKGLKLKELGVDVDISRCILVLAGNKSLGELGFGEWKSRFSVVNFPRLNHQQKLRAVSHVFDTEARRFDLGVDSNDEQIAEILDILVALDSYAGARNIINTVLDLVVEIQVDDLGLSSGKKLLAWDSVLHKLRQKKEEMDRVKGAAENTTDRVADETVLSGEEKMWNQVTDALAKPIVEELRQLRTMFEKLAAAPAKSK